jgi:hypothetical protein
MQPLDICAVQIAYIQAISPIFRRSAPNRCKVVAYISHRLKYLQKLSFFGDFLKKFEKFLSMSENRFSDEKSDFNISSCDSILNDNYNTAFYCLFFPTLYTEFKETKTCVHCVHWGFCVSVRGENSLSLLPCCGGCIYVRFGECSPPAAPICAVSPDGGGANCGLIFSSAALVKVAPHTFSLHPLFTGVDLRRECHITCQMSRERLLYCRDLPFPRHMAALLRNAIYTHAIFNNSIPFVCTRAEI